MREDEIQRYGRQILLRELGGRGQQKLLDARVVVHGEGPALDSAVTYLRAGGTPLGGPDAGASVTLVAAPLQAPREGPVVVVGGDGVAWRAAGGCLACFDHALTLLGEGAAPVIIGSLAALTVQRLLLGWGASGGLVRWADGRLAEVTPEPCAAHR